MNTKNLLRSYLYKFLKTSKKDAKYAIIMFFKFNDTLMWDFYRQRKVLKNSLNMIRGGNTSEKLLSYLISLFLATRHNSTFLILTTFLSKRRGFSHAF